jgi:hypothetical protein
MRVFFPVDTGSIVACQMSLLSYQASNQGMSVSRPPLVIRGPLTDVYGGSVSALRTPPATLAAASANSPRTPYMSGRLDGFLASHSAEALPSLSVESFGLLDGALDEFDGATAQQLALFQD